MSCKESAVGAGRSRQSVPLAPAAGRPLRGEAWPHIVRLITRWIERGRQRHDLAQLDSHLLQDIGVSREEAAREAAKPFWQE